MDTTVGAIGKTAQAGVEAIGVAPDVAGILGTDAVPVVGWVKLGVDAFVFSASLWMCR